MDDNDEENLVTTTEPEDLSLLEDSPTPIASEPIQAVEDTPTEETTVPAPVAPQKLDYTPDDPQLINALGWQESRNNPNAIGPMTKYGQAKGEFQFIDDTWKEYGTGNPDDVFNSELARPAAQKKLKHLYNYYHKDINLALAGYNYGEGNLNNALDKTENRTFSEVAKYLPVETRNYVPSVLGRYNKTSPELAAKLEAAKLPGIIDNAGFAKIVSPIVNSPEYQSLSATDQVATLNNIYQKNIYKPEVRETLRKMSDAIWQGASPEELYDLKKDFGVPSRDDIVSQKKNPAEYLNDWRNNKISNLEKEGILPELVSKPFNDLYQEIETDEKQAYEIRQSGYLGRFASAVGNNFRNITKGALDFPAQIAAGVTNAIGAHATASEIAKLPDTVLGSGGRFNDFEVDDKGYVLLNEDGSPRQRWQTNLFRGVGNSLAAIAGGTGLRIAGAGPTTIAGTLFAGNALQIGNQTFSTVYAQTGDASKGYQAALLSMPAAFVDTLMESSFISQYASKSLQGLSRFNQIRVFAEEVAKGATKGAVGGTAQDILQQAAEMSQTGQNFDPERTGQMAVVGGVTGGLVGPGIKGLEQSKEMRQKAVIKGLVNENLERFQEGHSGEKVINVSEDHVDSSVVKALGMDSSTDENGKTTFSKKGFVPDESVTVDEAIDNTLKYLTPEEIRDASHERALLLEKARERKLTDGETDRLTYLDERLTGTDDPAYINKIKANEADYLAKQKESETPNPIPVRWDAEKGVWVNEADNVRHPFLKGALGRQEIFERGNSDPASTTRPKQTHIPKNPARKIVDADFVQDPPHVVDNNTPTTPRKIIQAIKDIGKIAAKGNKLPAFIIKEGGRLGKGTAGLARMVGRTIRVRSLRDIPTLLHEITHAVDADLNDITYKAAVNNNKLGNALIKQARTFYPSKIVDKSVSHALREGLTMFLENKLSRQPVHKDLLAWWDGEFKAEHPELHAAYEKVQKLADAYYSMTPDAQVKAMTIDDSPGPVKRAMKAVSDIQNWISSVDKDSAFRAIDKASGHTGRFNEKSYRAFIEANDHSAQLIIKNNIQGDVYSDFQGNLISEQKTLKQVFEGLTPDEQVALKELLDLQNVATMIKRGQNPGIAVETVQTKLKDLYSRPDANALRARANEVYDWWSKTLDMAVKGSPDMEKTVADIREANRQLTGEDHGYYIPFERQDKESSSVTTTRQGNERTPNPARGRQGSDRPLKPFEERFENLARNWTEAGLKNQLIDRLILDDQMGKAVGGMLEKIPRKQALKFETTYADVLERASEALRKQHGTVNGEAHGKAIIDAAIKGGTTIKDIMDTTIQWWSPETSLSGKNAAEGYKVIARPRPNGGYDFYEIHPALMEAFSGIERLDSSMLNRFARLGKRTVQISATTLNPAFLARNIVRDFQAVTLLGETSTPVSALKTGYYMLAELADQAVTKFTGRNASVYAYAQRAGLTSASYMGAMKEINNAAVNKGVTGAIWKATDKTLGALEFITSLGENATRLAATRITAERMGIDLFDPKTKVTPLQAINLALAYKNSSVNFSKRGSNKSVNAISEKVPFFGARLAATSQSIEAAVENPKRALAIAGLSLALGIRAYLTNAGKEWYDDLSAETKAVAFTYDLGEQEDGRGKFVAIPLDSFNAVFYGLGQTMAQQFHEGANTDVEAGTAELIKNVAQQMSPIDLPIDEKGIATLGISTTAFGPVGKTAVELTMNYNTFGNGRPIVDEKKPAEEQFTEKTSETIKSIGRVAGMSPDKIEYFVRQFASGPLNIVKFFEKQTGAKPVNEEEGTNFLMRAFTREASNAAIQDQSRSKFYEARAKASMDKATETADQSTSRRFIERVAKKVTELNKQIAITDDKLERDKLLDYRRRLFRAGVASQNNPLTEMPTLDTEQKKQ